MRVGVYLEMLLVIGGALAIIIGFGYWLAIRAAKKNAGIRRVEYDAMKAERDISLKALAAIEEKADLYREMDSPLVGDVRQIIREHDRKRLEIKR